jgi:regulator of RNase E activity RraA
VRIAPGDWVVADASGVVIVPVKLLHDVVAAAERRCEVEERLRADLRAGVDPVEAFEKHLGGA